MKILEFNGTGTVSKSDGVLTLTFPLGEMIIKDHWQNIKHNPEGSEEELKKFIEEVITNYYDDTYRLGEEFLVTLKKALTFNEKSKRASEVFLKRLGDVVINGTEAGRYRTRLL